MSGGGWTVERDGGVGGDAERVCGLSCERGMERGSD
jgi:hypothetical protein